MPTFWRGIWIAFLPFCAKYRGLWSLLSFSWQGQQNSMFFLWKPIVLRWDIGKLPRSITVAQARSWFAVLVGVDTISFSIMMPYFCWWNMISLYNSNDSPGDQVTPQYMNVCHIEVFVYLQILQNKFLKSGSTFIVFWFWRLFNGVSLINTAYLAITTEKVWVSPLLSLLICLC